METQPAMGQDGNHATFCRLCEAFCGIIATVQEGRVTKVAPDFENRTAEDTSASRDWRSRRLPMTPIDCCVR